LSNPFEPFLDVQPRPWSAPELPSIQAAEVAAELPQDPAEQALAAARAEAAALLMTARSEAEHIHRCARAEGLAEAQAGLAQERQQLAAQHEAAVAEINVERERFLREAEPELLKLSFAIAEKVIARQVSEHPDIVLDLIRKSLRRIKDKSELRIRVNPEDLQLVKEARADLLAAVDGVEKIEVGDDRRVGRGGCIVESSNGTLDARIATQLRELEHSTARVSPDEPEHHS